jgi:hypothetical protein
MVPIWFVFQLLLGANGHAHALFAGGLVAYVIYGVVRSCTHSACVIMRLISHL